MSDSADDGTVPFEPKETFQSACIVALPIGNATVQYNDGGVCPVHQTLAWLGPRETISREEIVGVMREISAISDNRRPFTAKVIGKATLGEDLDSVVLTESHDLTFLRNMLIELGPIKELIERVEQHPNWISHVTGLQHLRFGDHILFNRLAVWYGNERVNMDLGQPALFTETYDLT